MVLILGSIIVDGTINDSAAFTFTVPTGAPPGPSPAGTKLRDRTRSVKLGVLAIARASRNKTTPGQQKMQKAYRKLLDSTSRVVGQARKFSAEIANQVKRGDQAAPNPLPSKPLISV